MINNLVYVFIENTFTLKEKDTHPYTYNTLPEYYLDTINFNKKNFGKTYLIVTEKQKSLVAQKISADINLVAIETLHSSHLYKSFQQAFQAQWLHYTKDVFLYHAFLRVLYYCLFVYEFNLENTIHAEADNLIFQDNIEPFNTVFQSGEFGFSNEKIPNSAPAIIFLKDKSAAENLLNLHIKLLNRGENGIRHACGIPFNYITDMNFLFFISQYKKNYKMLPCLPCGDQSENFDKFNMVFDPTSYGQYLGGTNNGHCSGFIDPEHYVGRELLANNIKIKFIENKPYVDYNDCNVPLFNLHIQNKKAIKNFL